MKLLHCPKCGDMHLLPGVDVWRYCRGPSCGKSGAALTDGKLKRCGEAVIIEMPGDDLAHAVKHRNTDSFPGGRTLIKIRVLRDEETTLCED